MRRYLLITLTILVTLTNLVLAADPHAPVHTNTHEHALEAHIDTHNAADDTAGPQHDCCATHTHVLSLPLSLELIQPPLQRAWQQIQNTLPQQQRPTPLLPPPIAASV